ncbi:MAG: hypothetical protein QGH60_02510 [Phycisphaerae bacterium]|jgi:hypothetical protein|nr:hypothetical protein [Phycisphaerae bacterium]
MNDTGKQRLDGDRISARSGASKPAGKKSRAVRCSRKWIDMVRDLPDIREDLMKTVRSRLVNGFYEEAECLDIAIDKLLDDADEVA